MKPIYLEVATGRKRKKGDWHYDPKYQGQALWAVHGFECSPDCACDGYEVCLYKHTHTAGGGYFGDPHWPILSCASLAEVEEWLQKVKVFARTLDPEVMSTRDPKYNGDPRLGKWLESQGFVRRSLSVWGIPQEKQYEQ